MRVDTGLGWATLIWFVLFGLHFTTAHAKTHECEADRKEFCADFIPGDGKFTPCMLSHEKELSASCRDEINKQKEERKKLFEKFYSKCETELDKVCKGVEHSDGKALHCLGDTLKRAPASSGKIDISDSCKNTIEALKKPRLTLK